MRVVVIGDVGVVDGMLHVGDEAMFEVLVTQLRARGHDVVGLSANPAETSARYGIDAMHPIGFVLGREGQDERMLDVLATARGARDLLETDDPAHGVIEAVRSSGAVAIAGGGSISSIWPTHVFERVTLGVLAEQMGRPLVISGQTLGPHLAADDAALVSRLLRTSRLTGLRDPRSFALAGRLGAPPERIQQTIDDASFLIPEPGPSPRPRPYCLVTLARHTGGEDQEVFADRAAALLDDLATESGLEIVFSAHFGSIAGGPSRGDDVIHDRVAERMTADTSSVSVSTAVDAARLAQNASLVVTSRYHPAVFAAAGGVPTIGIAVDEYTTVKLEGALGGFGQTGVLQIADLMLGFGGEPAITVWRDREGIRARAEALRSGRRAASERWWDRLADALR